jgi:hypothetical protein
MGLRPTLTHESPPACHAECYMGLRPTNEDVSPCNTQHGMRFYHLSVVRGP